MSRWAFLFAALAFALPGCGGDRSAPRAADPETVPASASPPLAATPSLRVSPSRDPASHVPVVPLHAQASEFVGGAPGYAASVAANGALRITPRDRHREGHALQLGPASLRRGAHAIARPSRASLDDAGRLLLSRADVTEQVEATAEGLEQSWRFYRAPEGSGDLVVELAATGQTFAGTTPRGLHFVDARSGLGSSYGSIAWVDATGRRTALAPRWTGDKIAITVPAALLDESRYPAVLDPTATPEAGIDQPIVAGAAGQQSDPAVASDGTDYLAVWVDYRSGRAAIYGSRIKADGTVLDPTGILIARISGPVGSYYSLSVAVAGSPAGYFVAWTVDSDDETIPEGVFGKRISRAGAIQDDLPLTLATGTRDPATIAIASNGAGGYFVAWRTYVPAQGYNIVGTRVDATGKPDPTPLGIATTTEYEYDPAVDWDGTNYFVVWRSTGVFGARVSGATGALVDATRIPIAPSGALTARLAFDGTNHLVAWYQYRTPGLYDVLAARVSAAGVVDQKIVVVAATTSYEYQPDVAWDGANFVVAWCTYNTNTGQYTIDAMRISAAGTLVDPQPFTAGSGPNSRYMPRLASSSSNTLAVWSDSRDSAATGIDIYGARIARATNQGALDGAGFRVSSSANAQTAPAVAYDGTNYFVVWLDTKNNERALYGMRVGPDGKTMLDPAPLRLSPVGQNVVGAHRVAFGGGYFVVLWARDSVTLTATRVSSAGALDAQAIDFYRGANEYVYEPDLAFDGTNFLVVFRRYDFQTGAEGIAALRASADILPMQFDAGASDGAPPLPEAGATLKGFRPIDGAPIPISPFTPNKRRMTPSVAWDGRSYFVAWGTYSSGTGLTHIHGTRVDKTGQQLDQELPLCTAFLQQRNPSVAADPAGGFFVVWQDYRSDVNSADVYGQRVTAAGQVRDGTGGIKISGAPADESLPRAIAAGGGTYAVVWSDNRLPGGYDLYGAWVNSEGRVLDPEGFAVSGEAGDESAPALAGPANGTFLVAYQRLDPGSDFGNWRTRVRAVTSGAPNGSACAAPGDCFSRFCVDGVCCSSACDQGCGVCNVTAGECTPKPRGPSPKCESYVCDGQSLACPDKCKINEDCANNTICDTAVGRCVSAVTCTDIHTLRDVTGKTSDCAPYLCQANACMTSCRSVDDCLRPFVCDLSGKCIPPPAAGDADGCSTASGGSTGAAWIAALAAVAVAASLRRKRSTMARATLPERDAKGSLDADSDPDS